MPKYLIEAQLLQEIADYLSTCPYRHVWAMAEKIKALRPVEVSEPNKEEEKTIKTV